jgi:hypothetical protein
MVFLALTLVGFISAASSHKEKALMRCSTVQDWLTHDDIFNLELTPIANRDTNDMILSFLRKSALADDPAHSVGERLRLMTGFEWICLKQARGSHSQKTNRASIEKLRTNCPSFHG